MTAGQRYGAGLAAVGLAGLAGGLLVAGDGRGPVWLAVVAALLVQGPLGWWLVRSVGRPRFLTVWGFGMLTRFALLVAAALALSSRLHRQAEAALVALGIALVALLAVEGTVLWLERSTRGVR